MRRQVKDDSEGDHQEEYLLAAHTEDREGTADADLYYTPPAMTDMERNEAITDFIRTTPPWQVLETPPDIVMF